jgi:hypothetical protein
MGLREWEADALIDAFLEFVEARKNVRSIPRESEKAVSEVEYIAARKKFVSEFSYAVEQVTGL